MQNINNSNFRYNEKQRQVILGALSAILMLFLFVSTLLFAFLQSGPIVLGTEMNDNGMVEYLCIGSGCDHLTDMDW